MKKWELSSDSSHYFYSRFGRPWLQSFLERQLGSFFTITTGTLLIG